MASRIRTLVALAVLSIAALAAVAGPAAAAPQYRGVHLHSMWADSTNSDMDRELGLAQGLGANVVRLDVGWDSLESGGKGQYSDWYVRKLDRFMTGANARGMKVIVTLTSTPCWASSAPESLKQGCDGKWWDRNVQLYAPSNPADYGDAARWITSRYGAKLAALEVWNEPNLDVDRFLIGSDKAATYASILKAAYPAAKRGNAGVPVIAGALAYMDAPFVRRFFASGVQNSYDGLSVHPYNDGTPGTGTWAGINWIRNLQRQAGQNKPLWITEFGWSTCRKGSGWCATEAEQARDTAAGFRALQNEPNVKAGIAYNLRDKGTNPADMEANFGLVRRDFTPKPAYSALRTALRGGAAASAAKSSIRLRLRRHRSSLVAMVRTSSAQRVTIAMTRCGVAGSRRFSVRTSRRGRAIRTLGSARRLRSCTITARGAQASVATASFAR